MFLERNEEDQLGDKCESFYGFRSFFVALSVSLRPGGVDEERDRKTGKKRSDQVNRTPRIALLPENVNGVNPEEENREDKPRREEAIDDW